MGEAELQGVAFLQQYVRSGEPRALDEAVTLLRRSVRETPPGTARGSCLSNLLVAVTLRCSVSDDPQDLAELVTVGRAAAAGSPTAQDLVLFGRALRRTHGRTGEPGELDEAIDVFGRGLRLSEPNDQRLSLLNDRALALLERYRRDGRAPDLAAAETDLHRALDLPDLEPVIRARTLANLATARFLHHQAGGDLAELRAAVELQRAAATACPAGVPERPAMLSGLAQFLTRAAVQGEAGAVTEGIDACRAGLALTPSGHPERPALLYRLGALLRLAVEAA